MISGVASITHYSACSSAGTFPGKSLLLACAPCMLAPFDHATRLWVCRDETSPSSKRPFFFESQNQIHTVIYFGRSVVDE